MTTNTADRQRIELISHLSTFAEGRKGWRMEGEHLNQYAARLFTFGRFGQIVLSVQLAHDLRSPLGPFVAQVNLMFSAGPEDSVAGKLKDVTEWVAERERALALPARLGECKTSEFAQHMVGQTPVRDVWRIGYYLDFEGGTDDIQAIRRRLVQEFGPKGARS